jgi:hypothetical protein
MPGKTAEQQGAAPTDQSPPTSEKLDMKRKLDFEGVLNAEGKTIGFPLRCFWAVFYRVAPRPC